MSNTSTERDYFKLIIGVLIAIISSLIGLSYNSLKTDIVEVRGEFRGYKEASTDNYHKLDKQVGEMSVTIINIDKKVDNIVKELNQSEITSY